MSEKWGWLRQGTLGVAYAMPLLLVIGRAAADMGVSAIALSALLHMAITRSAWLLKPLEVRWFLVFWLILVWSTCFNDTNTEHIVKSLAYVRFILFYAALRYWLYTHHDTLVRAAFIALPVLAFTIFDGWWQYVDGAQSLTHRWMAGIDGDRLTGPLSHPNLGNYLFKCLLVTGVIGVTVWRHHPLKLALLSGLLVAGILLIPLSGERSVTLMLIVTTGTFFGMAALGRHAYGKHIGIGIGVVILAVIGLATQPVIVERVDLFIQQVSQFATTAYGQLFYASWLIFSEHIWVGAGHGNFSSLCHELYHARVITYCDIHPHNMYLQWLVSAGIIGMVAIIIALGVILKQAWVYYSQALPSAKLLAAFQCALLAGLLFPAVVTQGIYSNWPAAIFWFSLAWIMSLHHLRVDHE